MTHLSQSALELALDPVLQFALRCGYKFEAADMTAAYGARFD